MVLSSHQIQSRLTTLGVSADKFLGQHFLIDQGVLSAIVQTAVSMNRGSEKTIFRSRLPSHDNIIFLEIGPGLGVLTEELVKMSPTIAVERDPVLAKSLPMALNATNLTVIQGNILEVLDTNKDFPLKFQSGLYSPIVAPGAMQSDGDAYVFPRKSWAVVANIPYGITSPLIRKLLECPVPPEFMVLMVQKEVAERICAPAGDSSRGLLTLMVQTMGNAQIVQTVPKTAFWPQPEVASAVIRIEVAPKFDEKTREAIFKLAQHAFAGKRKQLANALSAGLHKKPQEIKNVLDSFGLDSTLRAEAVTLEDWAMLAKNYQLS